MSIKATVNPAADTAEITKEELIADAREHETSLLDGLLTAAGFKTAEDCIKKVVISRGGNTKSVEQIAAQENVSARQVYRDHDAAVDKISMLMFGIDALEMS